MTDLSLPSRLRGRVLRPGSSIPSALLTLVACYALVAASVFLAAMPAYLGPLNFEAQFRFDSVPDGFSLPFKEDFDRQSGLRSIECTPSADIDPTAVTVADCRGIADNMFSDTQRYFEKQGVKVRPSYSRVSIWPVFGSYVHALCILGIALLIGLGWRRYSKHSFAADWRSCLDACASRPWLVLVPYALMITTASIASTVFGYRLPPAFDASLLWQVLLYGVVAAPVFEEIVFRGVVYDVLNKRLTWVVSGILSSGLFAAVHSMQAGDVHAMLGIFAGGFGLYWLRKETNSIAFCIVAHGLFNAIVIASQWRWAATAIAAYGSA